MNVRPPVDDLLDKLADGVPVDWDAAARDASPEESSLIENLKILAGVYHAHAGSADVVAPPPAEPPADASTDGPVDEPAQEPSHFGQYRLVQRIGQGSYGVVYLARDEQLDREVAIKLLHPDVVAREKVMAEGRALARVDHGNVVTVYGVEEHQGQLALCMKYIRGRTLEDIVRADGPMNADEALVVARAVCEAVAAVHAAGVLHRDIKARNVMRERNGRYVLMDFGAGVFQTPDGSSGTAATIGTPLYMAPELFDGEPASRTSDVYAIGVLLYFLVTGDYPIASRSIADIRQAHRQRRLVPLLERRPDVPVGFVEVVERAIAHEPDERYETAIALLRDLVDRLGGTAAPETRELVADRRETRRSRVLRQIAVGAATVALLPAYSGWVAASTFNRVIDRPRAFDPGSFGERWWLGVEALVLPVVIIAVLSASTAAALATLSFLPAVRRAWNRGWARAARALGVATPEHGRALAALSLLIAAVGFVIVWVIWNDVLYAFLRSVAVDELAIFEPLTPARQIRMLGYRTALPVVFFAAALVWRQAGKVGRDRGVGVPLGARGAALVAVVVLTGFEQAPYKLMTERNNRMPVVLIDQQHCYVLGQSGDESRVYCPAWPIPRVRSLPASALTGRCGFDANIFTPSSTIQCAGANRE